MKADFFHRRQLQTLLAVDDGVKALLGELRRRRILRDTIVVFMSDNGYSWGAHRIEGKGVPYEESIRVPLVIRYDRLFRGSRIETRTALNIDLAPTFAAAARAKRGAGGRPEPARNPRGLRGSRAERLPGRAPPRGAVPGDADVLRSPKLYLEVRLLRNGRGRALRLDGRSLRAREPRRGSRVPVPGGGNARPAGHALHADPSGLLTLVVLHGRRRRRGAAH